MASDTVWVLRQAGAMQGVGREWTDALDDARIAERISDDLYTALGESHMAGSAFPHDYTLTREALATPVPSAVVDELNGILEMLDVWAKNEQWRADNEKLPAQHREYNAQQAHSHRARATAVRDWLTLHRSGA